MTPKKGTFKRYNGSIWEDFYFKTSTDMVEGLSSALSGTLLTSNSTQTVAGNKTFNGTNYIGGLKVLQESKNILGTNANATVFDTNKVWFQKGALFYGTAADAGLVTRGISGVTTTGSSKDHLYLNYDGEGDNNYSRKVVLGAGSLGSDLGNGLYQYAAARGDAVKAYADANYAPKSHSHSYEPVITAGTTSQYYRGDKTWQTFPTIPTNNNQLTNGAGYITSSGNAATATKLKSILTTFSGSYPLTVNVNGTIYSHSNMTYTGSTGILAAPVFAEGGTSLTDKYAPKSHSHTYASITGKPTLATVATSGSYNDLSNKPTIPNVSITNGNFESGKYISAISASGHTITATKEDLPTGAGTYALPLATDKVRGGVKAATKGTGDTVEVKIDTSSEKLFVPTYPVIDKTSVNNALALGTGATAPLIRDTNGQVGIKSILDLSNIASYSFTTQSGTVNFNPFGGIGKKLFILWGRTTPTGTSTVRNISFGTPFASGSIPAVAFTNTTANSNDITTVAKVTSLSNSGMSVLFTYATNNSKGYVGTSEIFTWIAIGYA